MKTFQKFNRVEFKAAVLFLVLSGTWVFLTNMVFHPDIFGDALLIFLITILVFLRVKFSRKKLTGMAEEYKSLFETHPSPMWIFDIVTLQFMAVNQAAIMHYGYSKKEFLCMTIFDIRPPTDIPCVREALADWTSKLERESIWKLLKKNGEEIMVKLTSNDVTFNKRKATLIEAHDITEVLRQQQEIREMSLVAENTSNGVILSDAQGRIRWVNKAFEQTTGYSLAEVKGKYPRSFLHGEATDKRVEAEIIELAKQKKGFVGDIINYKKDGSPYWVHLNLSPIVRNGEIENIVVIQTDITELKHQSEQITDQYRRLREVAFMTSHNARSQLTNILGLCDIIDCQGRDAEQKKLSGYLKTSAGKLDEVIHNIFKQTSALEKE